jgi:UDP-N-acetyl-D-mannosaminuronic acid dehydrogenase
MQVCVVGLGYIGLPTAVVMASKGMDVYGYDINAKMIERIRSAETDIEEEGLKDMLQDVISSGKLSVGTEIRPADVFVMAVSTSLDPESMSVDLRALKSASRDVGSVLKKGDLVIVESTVTLGTTENVVLPILEKESSLRRCEDFYLAFCPERVLPGNLMKELVGNDRIIGGVCPEASKRAAEFYSKFVEGELHITDARTAEMAKLMENTYRAVNIALANEMALIAEKEGVDVYEAIKMANNHPRVNIHLPGPGVGGYCLTKDPWFLIEDFESKIIRDALEINAFMPEHVVDMLEKELESIGKNQRGTKVAILGLAYKGNVSDARESPGYEIYRILRDKGYEVRVHDPYVKEYMGVAPTSDLENAVNGVDAVIIATEHREYMDADWSHLYGMMAKDAIIVDTKNIVKSDRMRVRKLGVGR